MDKEYNKAAAGHNNFQQQQQQQHTHHTQDPPVYGKNRSAGKLSPATKKIIPGGRNNKGTAAKIVAGGNCPKEYLYSR